jgi:glycosyltransferase involved in cell wall biosynthesis
VFGRRWAINGRFLTQRRTGVQRYAREIVHTLDRLLGDGHPLATGLHITLLTPPDAERDLDLRCIETRTCGNTSGHIWEQLDLAANLEGKLLSLCNTGPVSVRHQIVCIHDLNTRLHPVSYSRAFRYLYRVLVPLIGRSAGWIATVSAYSADQLVRFGVCHRNKITVIPNGHEHAALWKKEHSPLTRSVATQRTIVLIGSSISHKNIRTILELAGRLAEDGLHLAIVGARDAAVFAAGEHLATAPNVKWLGNISDEELAALLSDSMCLAFPSLTEGFGLPLLEAMAIGCPVITSDRASMPEVCGDAALYASPLDPLAWITGFNRLKNDSALRTQLISRGRSRSMNFRWSDSAQQYLQLMATADGLRLAKASLPPAYME